MASGRNYAAYLLRWQWNDDDAHWHATVQNAHTGEVRHFVDRDDLLHWLWQALQAAGPAAPPTPRINSPP